MSAWVVKRLRCRACDANVFFAVHHRTDNTMIFNADPDPDGAWILQDGKAVPAVPLDQGPRYTSHHATCPEAARFRRAPR